MTYQLNIIIYKVIIYLLFTVLPNVQCNKEVSPDLPGFCTEIKKQDKSKSMLFPIILNGLTWFLKLNEWNFSLYLK